MQQEVGADCQIPPLKERSRNRSIFFKELMFYSLIFFDDHGLGYGHDYDVVAQVRAG